MPTIYARFMEKEAREWRQIYKVSHFHRDGQEAVLTLRP